MHHGCGVPDQRSKRNRGCQAGRVPWCGRRHVQLKGCNLTEFVPRRLSDVLARRRKQQARAIGTA
eukprot:240768-Prymnesium_polylepis.1